MKKAIVGVGLLICGTIGASAQRIIDTLFVVSNWTLSHSGINLMSIMSGILIVLGGVLCILSLKERE